MPLPGFAAGSLQDCCTRFATTIPLPAGQPVIDACIAGKALAFPNVQACMTGSNPASTGTTGGTSGGNSSSQSGNSNTSLPLASASQTCPAFSLSDPVPAVSCLFRETAIYLGVNAVAIFIVLFGVYLLFRPEINTLANKAISSGKQKVATATKVAEIAA